MVTSTPATGNQTTEPAPAAQPRGPWIAVGVGVAALALLAAVSPQALVVVIQHSRIPVFILAAATGLGLWLVRAIGLEAVPRRGRQALESAAVTLEASLPWRWRLLLAAGLGTGALSVAVLGLGAAGILDRTTWLVLLTASIVGGLVRLRCLIGQRPASTDTCAGPRVGGVHWLWLIAAVFAGLALLGATMPPGTLWPAEGNGYDVLEYHLGAPREYFEAGRIGYLPHNIYSNLPFNIEMLYLLTMVVQGDPVEAAIAANLLNCFLGMLAVAAVWLAGRQFGGHAGVVSGVVAASCPFLTYLSGLAYVENGLLFYTGLSLAAVLSAGRRAGDCRSRWLLSAGVLAGLACGCKYTAVSIVFAPLLLAVLWSAIGARPRRWQWPLAFVLGWFMAFGPWMAKNTIATWNPVFPLARGVFPEKPGVWNDDGAARWREGHLPAPEDRPLDRRLVRLWQEVIGTGWDWPGGVPGRQDAGPREPSGARLFGPAIIVAILGGGGHWVVNIWKTRRRRGRVEQPSAAGAPTDAEPLDAHAAFVCGLMIAITLVVWLGWTHLVGRFAVTLIVPSAVILGKIWERSRQPFSKAVRAVVLLGVVVCNAWTTLDLFRQPPGSLAASGAAGAVELMTGGQWPGQQHVPYLNHLSRRGARILMIGDARCFYLDAGADRRAGGVDYCVVFNRNPFAEAAAARPPAELVTWLRDQGYDYLYVDWGEMARLRRSRYGFWQSVDAALFQRLTTAGMEHVEDFAIGEGWRPYSTLYKVPRGVRSAQER